MTDLGFELHFGKDLIDSDVLDRLQAMIAESSPSLAGDLRVLRYERDPDPVSVDLSEPRSLRLAVEAAGTDRGATFDELTAASPPTHPRRFGSVTIRGAARGTYLSVAFDAYTPARPSGDRWLWSNSVSGRIGPSTVDGVARHEWVRVFTAGLAGHGSFLWGAACERDEFRARNIHDESDGTWALGRDMSTSLPGLYWRNLFGAPYVHMIGARRLTSLDATVVEQMGDSVLVEIYPHPETWGTDDGRQAHDRALHHLGRRFFYDRSNPDQDTEAPDFGLPELPPKPPFGVVQRDDGTFTPVTDDEAPEA